MMRFSSARLLRRVFCLAAAVGLAGHLNADTATLKNGMVLEGEMQTLSSLRNDTNNPVGEAALRQILLIDDKLRKTFVAAKHVVELGTPPAVALEKIPLLQRIATSGSQMLVVGRPLHIDPFDEFGRRTYSMVGAGGKTIDVVQDITEITPRWTKLEAHEGINHYIWTSKIATSSIPRDELSRILRRALDPRDPNQRIRIVRLYMQGERYQDAREELLQLLADFPQLSTGDLDKVVKELRQQTAQRTIKEIELRRDVGQQRLASNMLESFPHEGVAGETLLKVRELLDEIKAQVSQGEKILALIDASAAGLKADAARGAVKAIIAEIKAELNINTLDRFADFLRLANDPQMSAEQRLALAISGWLLGAGAAIDNLEATIGLVKVRDLVRQYLQATRPADRKIILDQLPSEATVGYVAAIVANMKPPLPTEIVEAAAPDVGNATAILGLPNANPAKQPAAVAPQQPAAPNPAAAKNDEDGDANDCAPPKDNSKAQLKGTPTPIGVPPPAEPQTPAGEKPPVQPPAAAAPAVAMPPAPAAAAPALGKAQATGIPGQYELTVNTRLSEEPYVKYTVLLPPEYDPYRRYPCIVTLCGGATTPQQQIDWWAGDYRPDAQTRYGQATRHGYIVIAPQWTREHQREYEFSSREHASVLQPLRDACKRFAIDVDRVFLTGHSMGGTAAWDIGLAHPDLWAGVIPIVATGGKYITQYKENGKYVPLYFVAGEKDTSTFANVDFGDWDYCLKHYTQGYDTMVVQYIGRGHESFRDEIHNLFTWMNLHRRDFGRKLFEVESLRPWDSYFWWVECEQPKNIHMVLPAEWGDDQKMPAKKPQPAKISAKPIAPNGVRVETRGFGGVTVWLSPGLVAFNNNLKVIINTDNQRNVQPKIETLLEDVRTRGDRQHPYWAKATWPN